MQQVDVMTSQGQSVAEPIRLISISEVTYYRWLQEFGKLKLINPGDAGVAPASNDCVTCGIARSTSSSCDWGKRDPISKERDRRGAYHQPAVGHCFRRNLEPGRMSTDQSNVGLLVSCST
jgi:hypothetical protein